MSERNIKTREGFDYWDELCAIPRYGFLLGKTGNSVQKAEGIGNWIDRDAAMQVMDEAQSDVNVLRQDCATLIAERDDLAAELAALKVGQDVAQHQYLSRGETARWWNIEESDVARAKEEGLEVRKLYARPLPQPSDSALIEALRKIYDEDYQVPHASTDYEHKEGMKQCIFRMRRIVREALAAYEGKP